MRLGIWTPRGGKADEDIEDAFRFAGEIVQKAEAYGFETTLVAQRFIGEDLEAWVLASALAAKTSKIELMVAVHPGVIPPQAVAKMGATLDRISNGRFAVNVVNGWFQQEMEIFGNGGWLDRSESRYGRMREFLEVVNGMWTQENFTFRGQFFRVEANPIRVRSVQQPHPPIYAASRADVGKDIIARLCEHWFVYYQPGHRLFESNFQMITRDVREMNARTCACGRKLSYGISATVLLDDSQSAAEAEADRLEERLKTHRLGASAITALGAGLVGTPKTIAKLMLRYEEIGVSCFMLRFPRMAEGLERFRAEVMPLLDMTSRTKTVGAN
jgi:FMNH2-dependent dimethyl sulfone monooxygenase